MVWYERKCWSAGEQRREGSVLYTVLYKRRVAHGGICLRDALLEEAQAKRKKSSFPKKGRKWSCGTDFERRRPAGLETGWRRGSCTQTLRRKRAKLNWSVFPWRSVRRAPYHYACLFGRAHLESATSMPSPAAFGLAVRPAGSEGAQFSPIDRSAPRRTPRLSFGVRSPDARTPTLPPPRVAPLGTMSHCRHCGIVTLQIPYACRPSDVPRPRFGQAQAGADDNHAYPTTVTELAGVMGWRHARSSIHKRSLLPNNRRPIKHSPNVRMARTAV